MGKLLTPFQFTGNFTGLSFYKMKGHDKIIIRRGKGPTKKQIMRSPSMKRTRKHIAEFSMRAHVAGLINRRLPQGLAGRNMVGPLNSILRQIQLQDTVNPLGEREISLSRYGKLLEGFEFSTITKFSTIIKKPINVSIDHGNCSAIFHIPSFKSPKSKYPWGKVEMSIIVVPDVGYNSGRFKDHEQSYCGIGSTDWQKAGGVIKKQDITLQVSGKPKKSTYTIIVGVGFRFGYNGKKGIEDVMGEGAGRIVGVG